MSVANSAGNTYSAPRNVQSDVESQTPIYAENVQPVEAVPVTCIHTQNIENPQEIIDQNAAMIPCAFCGLFFAWIPIVGCLTFAFNLDAPRYSLRFALARAACAIALIVVFFNIIFWGIY